MFARALDTPLTILFESPEGFLYINIILFLVILTKVDFDKTADKSLKDLQMAYSIKDIFQGIYKNIFKKAFLRDI